MTLELQGDIWVECLASAQVMISQFVSSSLASGSVLTAQSLEPALDSVCLSLCPFPTHALSLSLKKSISVKKYLKKCVLFSERERQTEHWGGEGEREGENRK